MSENMLKNSTSKKVKTYMGGLVSRAKQENTRNHRQHYLGNTALKTSVLSCM